jgi:hypothetical protein
MNRKETFDSQLADFALALNTKIRDALQELDGYDDEFPADTYSDAPFKKAKMKANIVNMERQRVAAKRGELLYDASDAPFCMANHGLISDATALGQHRYLGSPGG